MLQMLLNLVAPLGDVRTMKGKLSIAYKVALVAYASWTHFKEGLLAQHPTPAEPLPVVGE